MSFNNDGFVNIDPEAHHKDNTNRAADPRQQYPKLPDGSADPREATFNRKTEQATPNANSRLIYQRGAALLKRR